MARDTSWSVRPPGRPPMVRTASGSPRPVEPGAAWANRPTLLTFRSVQTGYDDDVSPLGERGAHRIVPHTVCTPGWSAWTISAWYMLGKPPTKPFLLA